MINDIQFSQLDWIKVLYIFLLTMSIFVVVYLYKFYKYFIMGVTKKNGLFYNWGDRYISSWANPKYSMTLSGNRWTNLYMIKQMSKQYKRSSNPAFINEFRLYQDFIKDCEISHSRRKNIESTRYFIDASKLCRTMVVTGSAGSGKTEFFYNLLSQNFYDKAIIFSKKFDFEKIYYRGAELDKIVGNPKLEKCSIHHILGEDVEYIEVFIESLINDTLGEKRDYFSSSAKQQIQLYLQRVKLKAQSNNLTIPQMWELFLSTFEEAFIKANKDGRNSQLDVMSTAQLIMDKLYLMGYRIIQDNADTFTVKEFFDKKVTSSRIFLSANDPSIEGLVAATYAVLIKYQLSLPNNFTNKPVLHLQDEFNSLARIVPKELLIEQVEVGRSKMFATLRGVQGLIANNEKLQELLTNNQYLVVFSGTEKETLKAITETVGNIEYEVYKTSHSKNGNTVSLQKESTPLIDNHKINILQDEEFSHIFISLKEKLLFKGYTPQVELSKEIDGLDEKINLNDFYIWKDERTENLEASSNKEKNEESKSVDIL